MDTIKHWAEHCIAFWYLIGHSNQVKDHFWNSTLGRFVLAVLPGVITAVFTTVATVTTIYFSMHEDVALIRSRIARLEEQRAAFAAEQSAQDLRIANVREDVANIKGVLVSNVAFQPRHQHPQDGKQ